MSNTTQTRVAELLFEFELHCDFPRAVSELRETLQRVCRNDPILNWDYDDIAIFDMPGMRILLSQSESPYSGFAERLTVAVGPSPIAAEAHGTMVHSAICVRLVERLKARCQPNEIRWNDIDGVISAEDVDMLCERMSSEQNMQPEPETAGRWMNDIEACEHKLNELRTKLHPYGEDENLPATLSRVASSSYELIASLTMLPSAALLYAAHWYRSGHH